MGHPNIHISRFKYDVTLQNVPGTVPLLSWQMRVFNNRDNRTIDPVLMFARSDVVYFFRVGSSDNVAFENCNIFGNYVCHLANVRVVISYI